MKIGNQGFLRETFRGDDTWQLGTGKDKGYLFSLNNYNQLIYTKDGDLNSALLVEEKASWTLHSNKYFFHFRFCKKRVNKITVSSESDKSVTWIQ